MQTHAKLFSRPLPQATVAPGTRALLLDDSEVDRARLIRVCRQAGLDLAFSECATIAEFAELLDQSAFDVVFLDYMLVQGDGLIALEMTRRHPIQRHAAAIMVAGEGQVQVVVDAMKNGCSDFIIKNHVSPDVIYRAVSNALEKSALRSALSDEEQMRAEMQKSLGRFAQSCGAEMRTILSAMLRRLRSMKTGTPTPEALGGFEQSCERLWDFLEEFHDFVTEASQDKRMH